MTNLLEVEEIIYNIENHEFIDSELIDLGEVELEKSRVKNLREKAALATKLIDHETTVYYSFPPRPKFEVLGGYKIALSRGAELNTAKVYNLYFRFKNRRLDGTSTAMMFREKPRNKEYILLLPDDTKETYEAEKRFYLNAARDFVFDFKMDSNEQNGLLENLNFLNRRERCAQSLQHEWGHILHYRFFDLLSLNNKADQLNWFYEQGYITLLDQRYPNLGGLPKDTLLYFTKEAFVEDVRISLNSKTNHGMFILPNAITFAMDFQDPILLVNGVNLVRSMLNSDESLNHANSTSNNSGNEIDRIKIGQGVLERHSKYAKQTQTNVSPKLIKQFIDEFEEEDDETMKIHVFK